MELGLGLYRHMLTSEHYAFARQAGCSHVVVHLVDYFNRGSSNARNNQPTGKKYEPWGVAGDPHALWTVDQLKRIRKEIEEAGLRLAAIENLDPAHWYDVRVARLPESIGRLHKWSRFTKRHMINVEQLKRLLVCEHFELEFHRDALTPYTPFAKGV